MSVKKPIPTHHHPQRKVCPVCGTSSYSQSGTHPQCALAREDANSKAARKAAEVEVAAAPSKKAWSKVCPKCKRMVPARRFACDCGHQFSPAPAVAGGDT